MLKIRFLIPLLLLTAGVLVLTLVSTETRGETIIVAKSGGDHNTIQNAINASVEGDTIRVYEGTYYENVVVNKSVSLIGNGSDITTIEWRGFGDVVTITEDWVNMSGFMVTGSGTSWLYGNVGIRVESDNNLIIENNCSNKGYGIYLSYSNNNTFENNTMDENGICISGRIENWNSHTIETTNTVNEKSVYYYKNVSGFIVPKGAGQVILANCTWINVENQNCSNGSHGILIGYSSNITLTNNTCSTNNHNGIRLEYSSNCILENNTSNNSGSGISLSSSNDCTITNNICSNNRYGISLYRSRYCTITNNTCSLNNSFGIYLFYSSNNTIEYNICSNNNDDGIYLYYSSNNTIIYNTANSNKGSGIYLFFTYYNTISQNTCSNNHKYGIGIYYSEDYIIADNIFTDNRLGDIDGHKSTNESDVVIFIVRVIIVIIVITGFLIWKIIGPNSEAKFKVRGTEQAVYPGCETNFQVDTYGNIRMVKGQGEKGDETESPEEVCPICKSKFHIENPEFIICPHCCTNLKMDAYGWLKREE